VAANLDPLDARADAAQPEGPHRMGGTGSTGSWTSGCQSRASFTCGPTTASPSNIQGGSRMRECRTSGSVRGAPSNEHPYRNPLASGTPLVAMISVPICARIDPLDPIGPPPCRGRSGDLHRPSPSTLSGSACRSRRCRDYRQGDGRDKSCRSAQLRRYHRGPDNRPRKESGSRRVPFLKTAPIINWPVCPW
jgi:hypothetical protein